MAKIVLTLEDKLDEQGELGMTTTVEGAVGAGTVSGHANEQRSVMSEIGGPPLLRVGHHRLEILLQASVVQALERFSVVEVRVHRVGLG